MDISFHGAAGGVTGSCHLVRVGGRSLLLDCGMFQGRREEEAHNRDPFPFDAAALDAVVLSHAPIDHSGRLPILARRGFRGPVFATPATIDLARVLLRDAAHLQEADAERENRRRQRAGKGLVKPLFTREDAEAALRRFRPLDFDLPTGILPGVRATLLPAGHILGAASVVLDLEEDGRRRRVAFSGDIGQDDSCMLPPPRLPDRADLVLLGGGAVGDDLPVRGRGGDDLEGGLEVGLVEAGEHALGVGGLELRVQVDVVVGRVDEAVQALAGVRVLAVGLDHELVVGRQVGQRDPGRLVVVAEVQRHAVEHGRAHARRHDVDEGARPRRGGEGDRGLGAEGVRYLRTGATRLIGEVEFDPVVVHGDRGRAFDRLVAGEIRGGH